MGDNRRLWLRWLGCLWSIGALMTSACLKDGAFRTQSRELAPSYGAVVVTNQQHKATVAMDGNDALTVQVATTAACSRSVTKRARVTRSREKKYHVGSIISFVYGGIGVVAGGTLYFIPAGETEEVNDDGKSTRQVVGKYVGLAGVVLVAAPIVAKIVSSSRSETSKVVPSAPYDESLPCPAGAASLAGDLLVRAPWGAEWRATIAAGSATVAIDWAGANIDPLASNAAAALAGAWSLWSTDGVFRTTWAPTPKDIETMRYAIGRAVGIEMDAERGGAPPTLAIKRLEIGGGGVVNAGERVQIKLTIENTGAGPAYRVVATTKSGMTALRGLHFSFGKIPPGASKSRTIVVDVPRQARESREPIIVQLHEYNDHVPGARTEQLTVRPSVRPALRVDCALPPARNEAGQPTADAGDAFPVRCKVDNTGGAPATDVKMTAKLGGQSGTASAGTIAPGGHAFVEVVVTMPKSAQLDERFPIEVVVTERNFNGSETWSSAVYAGTPSVCPQKFTDAEYRAKRKKLEKLRDDGILTGSDFDKRHAELVDCLQ